MKNYWLESLSTCMIQVEIKSELKKNGEKLLAEKF